MADTINNGIPLVPENTIDPAAGLNLALLVIDRLLQLKVLDMKLNTPPASPVAGSRYIVGTAPTGAWSGKNLQVAEWMPDGYWQFSPASVTVFGTSIWLNTGTDWVPASAGGGAAWGGITGTLADQADLAGALDGKAGTSVASSVENGLMSSADKNKLNGIQAGATANATDAYLLNRANHTGTQPASSISGLGSAALLNIGSAIGDVATVGFAGLGIPSSVDPASTNWPNTSLNDCTGVTQGFWRTLGATTDLPTGHSTANTVIFQIRQYSGGVAGYSQLVIDADLAKISFRTCNAAATAAAPAWKPWAELSIGDMLSIARGGTGANTAAGARNNLGLGAAALLGTQANVLDETAGKVLQRGSFGLGGSAVVSNTDWNTHRVAGFYIGSNVANSPPANAAFWHSVLVIGGPERGQQIAVSWADPTKWYRRHWTDGTTTPTWTGWSLIYDQSNILGTVSQSGGVPTGGLFQSGSNASGKFERKASGTQECWGTISDGRTASGTIDLTVNMPIAFIATDYVVTLTSDAANPETLTYSVRDYALNNFKIRSNKTDSTPVTWRWVAKGRWFA